jgi:shikimate kinase
VNVYLVGYMGSGKSTVGKQLARLLGCDFIDIDRQFEQLYKISIPDFFQKYDEEAFRLIERKLLFNTFELTHHVISTGGGTASYHDNMDLINQNGLSVYIKMHPNSLFVRLKHAKRPRPRIAGLKTDDLRLLINHDLQLRETYYNKAHFQVKGEDIDVVGLAEHIQAGLRKSL